MSKLQLNKLKETRATIKPLDEKRRAKAEARSGVSLKDVRVHYNSDLPKKTKAYGLTYGNQILLDTGREDDLEHELGHVIQQKKGMVSPQLKAKGIEWNLQESKEREATKLLDSSKDTKIEKNNIKQMSIQHPIMQAMPWNSAEFGEFLMEEHREVIEKTANKLVVSFRRAGKATIERMRYDSAHKGHNVLEKSIKDKTIQNIDLSNQKIDGLAETTTGEEKAAWLNKASGLVGHWSEDMKQLEGVYLSDFGVAAHAKKWDDVSSQFELTDDPMENAELESNFLKFKMLAKKPIGDKDVAYYVPLNNDLLTMVDLSTQVGKQMSRLFVTGDYDLHDIGVMVNETGEEGKQIQRMERIKDEDTTLSVLNSAFEYARKERLSRDYKKDDRSYIRHGVQFNYADFMKMNEPGKKMVYAQLNADPDLLFFNRFGSGQYNGWYHTADFAQLKVYYENALNVEMPERFGDTLSAQLKRAELRYHNLVYKAKDKVGNEYMDVSNLKNKYQKEKDEYTSRRLTDSQEYIKHVEDMRLQEKSKNFDLKKYVEAMVKALIEMKRERNLKNPRSKWK